MCVCVHGCMCRCMCVCYVRVHVLRLLANKQLQDTAPSLGHLLPLLLQLVPELLVCSLLLFLPTELLSPLPTAAGSNHLQSSLGNEFKYYTEGLFQGLYRVRIKHPLNHQYHRILTVHTRYMYLTTGWYQYTSISGTLLY